MFPELKRTMNNIETKYFEKYKNMVDWAVISKYIEKYKSGDIIFEPIRNKLTEAEQEGMLIRIDQSEFLSPQNKLEAIVGLMMILDGSFPEPSLLELLKKVYGKEFLENVGRTRKKFWKYIWIKRIARLWKNIRS